MDVIIGTDVETVNVTRFYWHYKKIKFLSSNRR